MVGRMDVWERLETALAELGPEAVAPPAGTRVGAALILLRNRGGGDLEVVYTRRRDDLRSHPGQISFPGGRVDPGESIEEAAVREAREEVALDPATVTVLGRLPSFYIPPSRFWLQAVVARWDVPHPLIAAEAEVAEVVRTPLSLLLDASSWRAVRLSTTGWSWAWDLGDGHLLWGATGMLTAVLLELLAGDWTGGASPGDLAPDRHVQPWNRSRLAVPLPGPARLAGTPARRAGDLPSLPDRGEPNVASSRQAGSAVADAVRRLRGTSGSVVVLAGCGWTGVVGIAAAIELARGGLDVEVVLADAPDRLPAGAEPLVAMAAAAGARLGVFDGAVAHAEVVVDALVGRGLHGPLRGRPLEMAHRLRGWEALIVAIDVPSGLDYRDGLVGELVPADVTVAVGLPGPGLFHPGLGPFVGDLYVASLTDELDPLVRLIPGPDEARWRE
jgi:hydroxyethylthiazole kinase-like uncharacterized protein yjeF